MTRNAPPSVDTRPFAVTWPGVTLSPIVQPATVRFHSPTRAERAGSPPYAAGGGTIIVVAQIGARPGGTGSGTANGTGPVTQTGGGSGWAITGPAEPTGSGSPGAGHGTTAPTGSRDGSLEYSLTRTPPVGHGITAPADPPASSRGIGKAASGGKYCG